MTTYIIRRILWGLLLLVLVIAVTFLVFYLLPSVNPAVLRAGRNGSPRVIAAISHNLGLDRPIYVQFWDYVKNIVLHVQFRLLLLLQRPRRHAAAPATPGDPVADRGSRGTLGDRGDPDRDPLRDQAPHLARPHRHDRGVGVRIGSRRTGWASLRSCCSRPRSDASRSSWGSTATSASRPIRCSGSSHCFCRGSCFRSRSARSTRALCAAACCR